MPLKVGTTNVGSIFRGTTPIVKIYRGGTVLYQLADGTYLRLIKDITISGSPTTSVTIDTDENSQAFSFGKDSTLMLVSDINNTSASSVAYVVYANNNQTLTNYYRQQLKADDTIVSGTRANDGYVANATSGDMSFAIIPIKLTNDGYITYQSSYQNEYGTANIELNNRYVTSTFTETSLTRFDIVASAVNSLGVGSRFQLYEVIN